ncbi:MAG: hypothetical protein ACKPJF_30635 [Dolichospermum sp.]
MTAEEKHNASAIPIFEKRPVFHSYSVICVILTCSREISECITAYIFEKTAPTPSYSVICVIFGD